MRLLERNDAGEILLTENILDGKIPPYAILSHTWGSEEVLLKDLIDGTGENKLGYKKIQFCGEQARRDSLRYFWVDTCCIDKTSSAELQETISCMFRWYRDAAKCYVYLADVSRLPSDTDNESSQSRWKLAFRKSRWFTRGWTLQELIAPASVEFFSEEGIRLGDKKSLEESIHEITGIPLKVLRGGPLSDFSISQRIAWIEKRETTRKEDKAYSILGIFDVHMPLLYGEGRERAFKRLQEEIDKGLKSKEAEREVNEGKSSEKTISN
jgi:Heterokaryon incompatibility protein (HET)